MLVAIIVTLFVAIQDPVIQKVAVRFASGFLSEKTGADIKVGRLEVTPDFRIRIEEVTAKDLRGNTIAHFDVLRTQIDVGALLEGQLHLERVELRGTQANIIKYEGEDKFNFSFIVDAFQTDKEKPDKEPMPIAIDKIVLRDVDFVYWDQNNDNPEKTENHLMDYSHIAVSGINLDATDFFMLGDSIHANIGMLTGRELSGLDIKHFDSDVTVCSRGIFLDGMEMETNNSLFDADIHMLFDDFTAIDDFVNKVTFDAILRPTDVLLSDIGYFTQVMYKMPDRLQFEGGFSGPIENFSVTNFIAKFGKATRIQGNLSMHPLDFENGEHTLDIKRMHFTYDDLTNFYIPSNTVTIPLPESLRTLNEGDLTLNFKGSYNDFTSHISLISGVGTIDASIARELNAKGDNVFTGYINGDRVQAGTIANATKYLGDLDLNAGFTMTFPKNGGTELALDGKIKDVQLLGNHIDEIALDGSMQENRFKGRATVDDDNLYLNFNGLVDFSDKKRPKSDFMAVIRNADLHALHLLKEDSISRISTNAYVNLVGFNLDDLEGEVHLDSTEYVDSRGSYFMEDFRASIDKYGQNDHNININCDFFDFHLQGLINFNYVVPSLMYYLDQYVNIPLWDEKLAEFELAQAKDPEKTAQDYALSLTLKNTTTLCRLAMPSLKIAKNTTFTFSYTSHSNIVEIAFRSPYAQFGKVNLYEMNIRGANSSFRPRLFLNLGLDEINYCNITERDTLALGLESFQIRTTMENDTVRGSILWNDDVVEDHNKAEIKTYFHPHELGGVFSILSGDIVVNDSLWQVAPSNFVDISDGRVTLSNLMFSHRQQSIRADGYVPVGEGDTLSVQLRNFDISNLDFYFERLGFDIDGLISGDALISDLKVNPMVLADLEINGLGVDGDVIGDAIVESKWHNEDKSVELNVNILDDAKKTLNLEGFYYTAKQDDNLDFTLTLDSLRISALSPFLVGVVSRLQGYGNGQVYVKGTPQRLDIDGRLKLANGGCKVDYLNTFYTFNPTIVINNDSIYFENMVLVDTLGNRAIVDGSIRHNHLKNMELNLSINPFDFLVMATTSKENPSFYGNVFAFGKVMITGPTNNINLAIEARTGKGTRLTLPLNRTSKVSDNDFIVFVEPPSELAEDEEEKPLAKSKEKTKTNFHIDLGVKVMEGSAVFIYLPQDIGTIEAQGTGDINLSTGSTEDLTLKGNYDINSGKFKLSFQELITRDFNLKSGGSIKWSGSPTDGRINATGAYTVMASLATLGMQVDSTSSSSNVNVECLIHLNNELLNPTITFGMNLPNASEEVQQAVFSLVDTTNQAVMTTQVMSLLLFGSFSNIGSGNGGTNILDAITMGGLNFNLGDAWGFGVQYHSSSANAYDELKVNLKTELFENRLIIETNLGVVSDYSTSSSSASNLVGEFDIRYKITEDGRFMVNFYNHSNYNSNFSTFSFDKLAPYTQGLGVSYSKSFDKFSDLFKKKRVVVPAGPMINKQNTRQ